MFIIIIIIIITTTTTTTSTTTSTVLLPLLLVFHMFISSEDAHRSWQEQVAPHLQCTAWFFTVACQQDCGGCRRTAQFRMGDAVPWSLHNSPAMFIDHLQSMFA